MKIGYPCINRSLGCSSSKTFRLKSYSENLLIEKINNNLDCLLKILKYNREHNILFFRISSDLIPFASHPVCTYDWKKQFKEKIKNIGYFIRENQIRISMHPDQFTLINSPDEDIFKRSKRELQYHADILALMGLDSSAKIQIHVGGVYGDKEKSITRFIKRYKKLSKKIKEHLVIENDEKSYCLADCLNLSARINIPVLFDVFHHSLYNNKESLKAAFVLFSKTWSLRDGVPLVDYSSQAQAKRSGSHTESIDLNDFTGFIKEVEKFDFDLMLEIKDKEKSVLKVMHKLKLSGKTKKTTKKA